MNRNSTTSGTNSIILQTNTPPSGGLASVALPWEGRLVAGDVIRLWGFQSSGANLDITDGQAAFSWVRP
jgi:hypothetical protein